jgi:methylenetetrahydrofolate dehydrogenase (NADP+)/methenyltetrahydrofolate cyclohydrolase
MSAQILDGRTVAKEIQAELAAEAAALKEKYGITPTIAVVRAGEDPASVSYANTIKKTFESQGFGFRLHVLPETAPQEEMIKLVKELSADPGVHGIILQEPFPKGWDEARIKESLDPAKDVDGVHPVNAGRLAQVAPVGRPPGVLDYFVPATPLGGLELLKRYGITISGKRAVVVGRSNIVGKPMAMLLLREDATVTICHSRTPDLGAVCREADILCVAVGRAKLITADMVKPGAVVVDFGVNFVDGKMVGDVDFEAVKEVASAITPVPGGTGPMTNAMLLKNVLEAAKRQQNL